MAYSEDHIALAAEYALGTLDADERAQVETMMAVDTEFTAIVHAWEYRLGVLNQMVGSVEPRPIVWENIKAAIGHSGPQAPLVLPEAPPPPPAAPVGRGQWRAACRPRRQVAVARTIRTSSSCRAACGAGAMSRRVATALAAALIAMLAAAGLSAGSVAGRHSAEAAHPDGRGQDAGAAGRAVGAICRAAAA